MADKVLKIAGKDPAGLARGVRVGNNGEVIAIAAYDEVADNIVASLSEIEPSTVPISIYETDTYTRIEYLEFASTNPDLPSIQIIPKNKSGPNQNALGIARHETGGGGPMSMKNLDESMSSLFDKLHRDTDGAKYALNRYLTFPHGVLINITPGGFTSNFALRGYAVKREPV